MNILSIRNKIEFLETSLNDFDILVVTDTGKFINHILRLKIFTRSISLLLFEHNSQCPVVNISTPRSMCVETSLNDFDILVVTDTHLDNQINDSDITLDSFPNIIHRKDRSNSGGGLLIYSKNDTSVRIEHAYSRSVFFQTITHWALGLKTAKSRDRPFPLPHQNTHRSILTHNLMGEIATLLLSLFFFSPLLHIFFMFGDNVYMCVK
jgi:hypothetical protein